MALFSTREATSNFINVIPQKLGPYQSNREFYSYPYYAIALGPDAIPYAQWEGQDVYWLVRDRQMSNHRWQVAMNLITANQSPNYLEPFAQINAYYKIMHIWVIGKKHQIRWLYGAYSLVNSLSYNYSALSFILQSKVLELLKDLNVGICNYAITQFYLLLFGIYANSPRIDNDGSAWAYDRTFIIGEQNGTAFPIYNASTADAREVMSGLLNDVGWRSFFKDAGSLFQKKAIPIPTFPQLYHSDVTDSSERYGQDARIEVPLVMLYPNHFFYTDTTQFSTDPDPNDPNKKLNFSQTKISTIIKGMESISPVGQYVGQLLGARLMNFEDSDSAIYNAYLIANKKVMNIFK